MIPSGTPARPLLPPLPWHLPYHWVRFFLLLQKLLLLLRSLLWARPTSIIYNRSFWQTRTNPVPGFFSTFSSSWTLKLLRAFLILVRLLWTTVSDFARLQDVFSLGPQLCRPPLLPTPPLPWMAPASLATGFEAPWFISPRHVHVTRPPLLPLALASLHGSVALPDKSNRLSTLSQFCWRPLQHGPGSAAPRWQGLWWPRLQPHLLPACRLARVQAILALKIENSSNQC